MRYKIDTIKIYFQYSNNGGEYVSNKGKVVLFTQGISYYTTSPYILEQNLKAERFNGIIIAKVNLLLIQLDLPYKYQPLVYAYANYIRNFFPYTN